MFFHYSFAFVYFLIHNRVYAGAIYKQSGKYLDSPDRM